MLNFVWSFLVFCVIACLFVGMWAIIRSFVKRKRTSALSVVLRVIALALFIALLLPAACFGTYVIPWDRKVSLELVSEITTTEEFDCSWYCIYDYEVNTPGINLVKWLANEKQDFRVSSECDHLPDVIKNDGYVELDLDHYSYLIVFGSEAEKLTWNAWDTWDSPLLFGAGRKWGTLTCRGDSSDFDPHKIYIYKFPHEAIENRDVIKWA